MKVGFVILNYNSGELAITLAKTLKQYDLVNLIIVVDNCSTDNSYDSFKTQLDDSKFILVRTDKNGGYSYGNNIGMEICKQRGIEIAFIANPDILITEENLSKIIDAFNNTDYSLLSTLQYEIDGSLGKPIIQKRFSYKDDLIDCFCLIKKIFGNKGKTIDNSLLIQPVDMFRGSFFGIRTADFFAVNGFDSNVFLFCEERILSKRLESKGYKLGILINGRYDHMHSVSINRAYKKTRSKIKILYMSRLYYNKEYNNVGKIRLMLLKLAMKISLLEYRLMEMVQDKL